MWFKNALVYHYDLAEKLDFSELLKEESLKPCPPHARFIFGWLPVLGDEFSHQANYEILVCLGKEERILPRAVLTKFLQEKIAALELEKGRAVKKAERTQILSELEFELLPKSFCIQKRLHALLDTKNQRLLVNTASATQAKVLLTLLRKSLPGLQFEAFAKDANLALKFVEWITEPASLSQNFVLANTCQLFALDNEKKRFSCKGYELPATEIDGLIKQGLVVAEISLIWKERIQFTLTQDFVIKNLKCLDYLTEEFSEISKLEDDYQQKDASLCLLGEELRALISDLEKELSLNKEKKPAIRLETENA